MSDRYFMWKAFRDELVSRKMNDMIPDFEKLLQEAYKAGADDMHTQVESVMEYRLDEAKRALDRTYNSFMEGR